MNLHEARPIRVAEICTIHRFDKARAFIVRTRDVYGDPLVRPFRVLPMTLTAAEISGYES